MREYEFEVTIVAVVRVRAGNEDRAREVVASWKRARPHSPTNENGSGGRGIESDAHETDRLGIKSMAFQVGLIGIAAL